MGSAARAAVAKSLNDESFRTELAQLLATKYKDQIIGPRGENGTSPAVAEVVDVLMKNYSEQLRGLQGASPSAEAVAAALIRAGSPSAAEVAAVLSKDPDFLQKMRPSPPPRPQSHKRRRFNG